MPAQVILHAFYVGAAGFLAGAALYKFGFDSVHFWAMLTVCLVNFGFIIYQFFQEIDIDFW